MPLLEAPESVLPALPTSAPIEIRCEIEDWVYVVARWPFLPQCERFVWRAGEADWTKVVLH